MENITQITDAETVVLSTRRVQAAIQNSLRVSRGYFQSLLETRTRHHPNRAGSFYDVRTPEEVFTLIALTLWGPYGHPEIKAPAVAFKAAVPGLNGMFPLKDLPGDREVLLLDPKGGSAHWDGKQKVSACVYEVEGYVPTPVGFTVLMVGPVSKEDPTEIVWTFHPGEPIAPPMVDRFNSEGRDLHRTSVRVGEAMGLTHAKLTPLSLE